MEVLENNIYPIFDRMLGREDKEALLGQRGVMVWFTGLSGSGKSTIAIALDNHSGFYQPEQRVERDGVRYHR